MIELTVAAILLYIVLTNIELVSEIVIGLAALTLFAFACLALAIYFLPP